MQDAERGSDPGTVLAALERVYGTGAPEPLRLTPLGLYAATPIEVLVAGFQTLLRAGALGPPRRLGVLDAGSGDGRMLAALALCAPPAFRLRLVGVECDAALHAVALARSERLAALTAWPPQRRLELTLGDFTDAGAVRFGEFDLVLHYPDGAEAALARQLDERGGRGSRLLLLQPDRPGELEPLVCHWRGEALTREGVTWHVALLGRGGGHAARLLS